VPLQLYIPVSFFLLPKVADKANQNFSLLSFFVEFSASEDLLPHLILIFFMLNLYIGLFIL
jgi:hypothetical protein